MTNRDKLEETGENELEWTVVDYVITAMVGGVMVIAVSTFVWVVLL